MPAKSEKQRRFMGAELARKRAGEETRTDMSEAKLGEFASKQKLDWRGAWVTDPALQRNASLNRIIATENKVLAREARRKQEKRRSAVSNKYGKNPFQKEEAADMNYQDFASQLDTHINHLEKRHRKGMSDTEAREFFDRDAAKVMSGRQRKRDAELRQERGLPEEPVTHVDRSVKFRDLETKQDDMEKGLGDVAGKVGRGAKRAWDKANEPAGYEVGLRGGKPFARRTRDEEEEARTPSPGMGVDGEGAVYVVKSKTLHPKDLLPAQDSNGNMIPNDTIPFTQETNQLMSLAAAAIETYVMKDYTDDNEVDTKAVQRNKRKASERKMKISGAGVKNSQRMIGRKAAKARGEAMG